MNGPPPRPTAIRRAEGNRGKRRYNRREPAPPPGAPECPDHLDGEAREEWFRLVGVLTEMGVIATTDRAVLATYCQTWSRWVEAEQKLKASPLLIRTPSGYIQQSPWLNITNKQLELMGRLMAEIGLTPSARSRIVSMTPETNNNPIALIKIVYEGVDGTCRDADGNIIEDVPEDCPTIDPRI